MDKPLRSATVLVLYGFVLSVCLLSATAQEQKQLHVDEFGIQAGEPVDAGFVFVDGQYLDKPYVVSRKGLALTVNGKLVRPPAQWPPRDLRVFDDPELPAGIDENSRWEDLKDEKDKYAGYLSRKARYLRLRFPDQLPQKKAEAYGALPFVESAVVNETGDGVIVKTVYGETRRISACAIPPDSPMLSPPPTREQVLAGVEDRRRRLEADLEKGAALFLFNNGQRTVWSARKAQTDMPYLLQLLESAKSQQEKMAELVQMDLLSAYPIPRWENFLTNFAATAELRTRVATMGVNLAEWERQRREWRAQRDEEDRVAEQMREAMRKKNAAE